jgi:hypothetical protein
VARVWHPESPDVAPDSCGLAHHTLPARLRLVLPPQILPGEAECSSSLWNCFSATQAQHSRLHRDAGWRLTAGTILISHARHVHGLAM